MFVVKTLLPRSLLLEDVARDVPLEDVATQGVSAKRCCYQRTINANT